MFNDLTLNFQPQPSEILVKYVYNCIVYKTVYVLKFFKIFYSTAYQIAIDVTLLHRHIQSWALAIF